MLCIYGVFCTMDECDECTDQSKCNSINVESENLYCFKADLYDPYAEEYSEYGLDYEEEETKCIVFPKKAETQKLYWQIINGFIKELFSFYGKSLNTEYQKDGFNHIQSQLMKPEKESYSTDEVIKTGPGTLSSLDKDILTSENTCSFHLYGKYFQNPRAPYSDITDKNTCFNARKFNEFKNLIDCGYAIIKFKVDGEDYEIKTCYLVPTSNLPQDFKDVYMEYIEEDLNEGMLNTLLLIVSGKYNEEEDRRRLSSITFNMEVENKYGRKVKYSSDNTKSFEIIAEGEKGPEEALEGQGNHNSYININLILLFLLVGF